MYTFSFLNNNPDSRSILLIRINYSGLVLIRSFLFYRKDNDITYRFKTKLKISRASMENITRENKILKPYVSRIVFSMIIDYYQVITTMSLHFYPLHWFTLFIQRFCDGWGHGCSREVWKFLNFIIYYGLYLYTMINH